MFKHIECDLPTLSRKSIDGVRYYNVNDRPMVSITSVTSHFNKHIFVDWRKRIGDAEANRITKRATTRGTATHELIEKHLLNEEVVLDNPSSKILFLQSKKVLRNINNIYALEKSLYSSELGVAGTVDCIAEYNGELSIIDFKTSRSERNDDWNENYYIQASAYAEMFEERTGHAINQIVILVVTEDGVVQEFIKDKNDYLGMLVEAVDDFTQAWEKENEKLDESPAVIGAPV